MTSYFSPVLAEIAQPLFGSQWLALLFILACITAFLFAVAALGRWLAATHPDEPAKTIAPEIVDAPLAKGSEPSAAIFAAIAAAVAVTLGAKARITAVSLSPVESDNTTDPSRQQWSMEGRRQIYFSHKVR